MYKIVLVISLILSNVTIESSVLETPAMDYYETLAECEKEKAKVTVSPNVTIESLDCVLVDTTGPTVRIKYHGRRT